MFSNKEGISIAPEADYTTRLCAGREIFIPDDRGERSLLCYTSVVMFSSRYLPERYIPAFIYPLLPVKREPIRHQRYPALYMEPEEFSAMVSGRVFGFTELLEEECTRTGLVTLSRTLRRVKRTWSRYEQARFALVAFHAVCSAGTPAGAVVLPDEEWLEAYLSRHEALAHALETYLFLAFYHEWSDHP